MRPSSPAPDREANHDVLIAGRLLEQVTAGTGRPLSASVYETARLVRLAPWVWGHHGRVDYLMALQGRDGAWGGPGGYALVPTLSATEALLHLALARDRPAIRADSATDAADLLATAADRGLQALRSMLGEGARPRPPVQARTVGSDILVPHLVKELNGTLRQGDPRSAAYRRLKHHTFAPFSWPSPPSLPSCRCSSPRGCGRPARHQDGAVGARAMADQAAPPDHRSPLPNCRIFEATGALADAAPDGMASGMVDGASGEVPAGGGLVGGSPAATAAWLAGRPAAERDSNHTCSLEEVARRYGGPVPGSWPATEFEQGHVVAALARAGLGSAVPRELRERLWRWVSRSTAVGCGPREACAARSAAVHALGELGARLPSRTVRLCATVTWARCGPGEPVPSPVATAHTLEAVGAHAAAVPGQRLRWTSAIIKITRWLCENQHPGGHWEDPGHASPYYATSYVTMAMSRHGDRTGISAAARAGRWIRGTQRPDGSWGVWGGTAEETAYALQALLALPHDRSSAAGSAAALTRGAAALRRLAATETGRPPLWHGKDLYAPVAIIDAVILSVNRRLVARSWPAAPHLL
ncbi:hypothetical protein ACQEU6_02645 [Spirillospora sp. CA-108201]